MQVAVDPLGGKGVDGPEGGVEGRDLVGTRPVSELEKEVGLPSGSLGGGVLQVGEEADRQTLSTGVEGTLWAGGPKMGLQEGEQRMGELATLRDGEAPDGVRSREPSAVGVDVPGEGGKPHRGAVSPHS